jgi:hypothetical protein
MEGNLRSHHHGVAKLVIVRDLNAERTKHVFSVPNWIAFALIPGNGANRKEMDFLYLSEVIRAKVCKLYSLRHKFTDKI